MIKLTQKQNIKIVHHLTDGQLQELQKLYTQGWWSLHRSIDDCTFIIKNSSFILGIVNQHNTLIAFARVLTDYYLFSYVYDVLVDEQYRGIGLGKELMKLVLTHNKLKNVKYTEIVCRGNMEKFYEQFNFSKNYGKSISMRYTRDER